MEKEGNNYVFWGVRKDLGVCCNMQYMQPVLAKLTKFESATQLALTPKFVSGTPAQVHILKRELRSVYRSPKHERNSLALTYVGKYGDITFNHFI